ncbi:MAG: Crp/Fnr family transcriptional regulator [Bradymonadia bacterium]
MQDSEHTRSFPAGSVLFREGDQSREMYVIVSGRVRISKQVRQVDKVIATLPVGEFFGEMATLNRHPRSATATVLEDAELLVVPPEAFDGLIHHRREVALKLIRRLADRLAQTNREMTLLMFRDPLSRVAHALRMLGQGEGQVFDGKLQVLYGITELAEKLGLAHHECAEILAQMAGQGVVSEANEAHVLVSDPRRLERLVEYLDLKHEFGALG